jgi:hypothetical protein
MPGLVSERDSEMAVGIAERRNLSDVCMPVLVVDSAPAPAGGGVGHQRSARRLRCGRPESGRAIYVTDVDWERLEPLLVDAQSHVAGQGTSPGARGGVGPGVCGGLQ